MNASFAVAWLGCTLLPLAAPIWCWLIAKHLRSRGWIAHLMLVPVLLPAYIGLLFLAFLASGQMGDGGPGIGFAFLPSAFFVLVGIGTYYVALVVKTVLGRPLAR